MSLMDSLLARLGLIRMKKYGLAVSSDGRLVGGPDMASDSWQSPDYLPPAAPIDLFLGDARQLVPTTQPPSPPRAVARGTDAPPIALVNASAPGPIAALAQGTQSEAQAPRAASDEEEWEWKMAMARAKAVEQAPAVSAPTETTGEDTDEWEWKMAMARAKSKPEAPPPPAPGAMAVGTAPTPRVEARSVAAPPKRPPAAPKRPARITASPPTEESLRKLREQAAATRPSTPVKRSAPAQAAPAKAAARTQPLAATSTKVGPRPVPKLGKPAGRSGKVRTPLATARTERARSAGDDNWQGEDTIAENTERRLPSLSGRTQATRPRSSALAKAGASTLREHRAR